MRALLAILVLVPLAVAAPTGPMFEEEWENGAGAWSLDGPASIDCAIGHDGCSLAVMGIPTSGAATTRTPQVAGFVGVLSADVRVGVEGDGSSLLGANHETGFAAAYIEPRYGRVGLATSAGQWHTAYLPIEAEEWYHVELRIDAMSVTYTVSDEDGATLSTLGPVPTGTRLVLLRSIEVSASDVTEAPHHWDNIRLVADVPGLATLK